MIESVSMALDPTLDVMESIEPLVKQVMEEKTNLKESLSSKKGTLVYYKNMLKSLPPILANAIHKINDGEINLSLKLTDLIVLSASFHW